MDLLAFLRPKPGTCSACGHPAPGLHRIYSGLRDGGETARLCTGCLLSQLRPQIERKAILFFEPLTGDGYCYHPPGNTGHEGLTEKRIGQALGSLAHVCARCTSKPQHLWMPLADLDENAMEKQAPGEYWNIPSEASRRKETVALCTNHLLEHLKGYLERKRIFFLTFRYPSDADGGYYG